MKNHFGHLFTLTTFGESHGGALGAVIDGCPAGVHFDEEFLLQQLERRRPGKTGVSARNEADRPEILSGIFDGKTLGTPIAILVRNQDARSQDYEAIKSAPRAGHADDVWKDKFGISDHRGGGRSSGRETVARVIGGSVAQMFLRQKFPEFRIQGFLQQVGPLSLSAEEQNSQELQQLLEKARSEGESFGARIGVRIQGVPKHLGQPVFHKLKSDLAAAVMSIGATNSFELQNADDVARAMGTEFHKRQNYSGIRGGISTGEDIFFSVTMKPTSSILDVAKLGRHDPCIGIRAVPVIESMAALVIADHVLWGATDKI